MKSIIYTFTILIFLVIASISCNEKTKLDKKVSTKKEEQKTETSSNTTEPVIAINKKNYKIIKEIEPISIKKDYKAASQSEIIKMTSGFDESKLNDKQKVLLLFFKHCANKDFNKASKLIAYNGKDLKRKSKDHYNMTNANEAKIVKSTVDVVYGILASSQNFQFTSSNDKTNFTSIGVSFFKKPIGIKQHTFDITDGLIVGMR